MKKIKEKDEGKTMDNFKSDIKYLIQSIREIQKRENEQRVIAMVEDIRENKVVKSRMEKDEEQEGIDEEIFKVAQKKEEIVAGLENKRAILGKNMKLTQEQKNTKLEFLKEEQEALEKRIASVSKTIEHFEELHGKDSQTADYIVLKDNRERWVKEYETNELEIESIEIPNPEQVYDKIQEMIDEVIYLNMENVETTNLREFIGEEISKDKENKMPSYQAVDLNMDIEINKPHENKKQNVEKISEQKVDEAHEDYIKNIFENQENNKNIRDTRTNEYKTNNEYKINNEYESRNDTLEENNEVEIKNIMISAKDNYAYLIGKKEKYKWDLSKIIKTKDVINKEMISTAKELGFSNRDILKIKRRSSPVEGYILNYLNDEETTKKYLLGIVVDKKVSFKLKFDLKDSSLDKKTFKKLNKYAKKEAKVQGVVVEGAKYNIFEKIKLRFNSNIALGDGKTYTNSRNENNIENNDNRKENTNRNSFIENMKIRKEDNNRKIQEATNKANRTIARLEEMNEYKTDKTQKNERDNLMVQTMRKEEEER